MNQKAIRYPAKLLLFGEYSILLGSRALSIPFGLYGAALAFIDHETGETLQQALESNLQLQKLSVHFLETGEMYSGFLDLHRFISDIHHGLYLASDIPQRYGLGSSGALCAAIYARYATDGNVSLQFHDRMELSRLRSRFSEMESFFHGKSSGFDPLVIYLQQPLQLGVNNEPIPVDLHNCNTENVLDILLVDSGLPCSTGLRVREFMDKYQPAGKVIPSGKKMISLTNTCIDHYLNGVSDFCWDALIRLSEFQFKELNYLIPAHLNPLWREGLQHGVFACKLCGSGGGGFLICFTREKERTINFFENRKIPVIQIPFSK